MNKIKKRITFALLPPAILLLIPWVHNLAFNNILLAIPDLGRGEAHFTVLALSVVAVFATGFIADVIL